MFEECPLPRSPLHPTSTVEGMIESTALSWNSKVANAILAQVQDAFLGESRESFQQIEQ